MGLYLEQLKQYPCKRGICGVDFSKVSINHLSDTMTESGVMVEAMISPHKIGVYESTNLYDESNYHMEAVLSGDTLFLGMRTRRDGIRHIDFFAKEFVIATIGFFEENGLDVKSWLAWWMPTSDNYHEYKRNIRQGLSFSQAAEQTWTGRLANELGFANNIRSAGIEEYEIKVMFER